MRILKNSILFLLVSTTLCATEISPLPPLNEKLDVKESEIPGLDLEALKTGELSVKPESVAQLFGEQAVSGYSPFGYAPPTLTLVPYYQEFTYSYGELCHVAHYSDVTVVTMMSGPTYGYQVIMSPWGQVLSTQPYFYIDSNFYGQYFRHVYLDVTIVTGTDQVVYFN